CCGGAGGVENPWGRVVHGAVEPEEELAGCPGGDTDDAGHVAQIVERPRRDHRARATVKLHESGRRVAAREFLPTEGNGSIVADGHIVNSIVPTGIGDRGSA